MEEKYLLIVDTESYAGNFERQLGAYMTGQIGDCGVGQEEANLFIADVDEQTYEWFADNISDVPDDNGNRRPANISPTPGWFNTGHGKHYRYGKKECETKYPAYLSVEMEFYKEPPSDMLDLMCKRAYEFSKDTRVKYCSRPKKITAIRLVKRITQDIEVLRK